MRPLILSVIILLMSAICSCRSAKQTVTQSAETAVVESNEVKASVSSEEILSLINSSSDIDLEGITVEFFPPDSAHPHARAAPKAVRIESAKAKTETNAAKHEVAAVNESDSINLHMEQDSSLEQTQRSNNDFLRPSDWVIFFSILDAIVILIAILIIKLKRNGTLF